MDLTPLVAADRQVIESYGRTGFRVSGVAHEGAVLVFPEATQPWAGAADIARLTRDSFAAVLAHGEVEILLVGCGPRMALFPAAVRAALREAGIVVDTMDTGAACRTYNVLLAEDRRVAAALLPAG
jgi:uncharacterized protein